MVQKNAIQGRQKIAMKKIAKKSNLQVTFSKRRTGLFKKASELCTLCGVDIAIIVFSPAGRVFSFGHPYVDSAVNRFLNRNTSSVHYDIVEAHRNANIHELNAQLTHLLEMLEGEKRKGQVLEEVREAGRKQCWWQAPIHELGLSELQQLRNALEELKRNVGKQANLMQAAIECSKGWPFLTPNGVGINNFGTQGNEMKASSSITQMHKFGPDLYFDF